MEIDCPDCEGTNNVCHNCGGDCYEGPNRLCENAGDFGDKDCPECDNGKITVYTSTEMKKAVDDEREGCALICEEIGTMYIHANDYTTAKVICKAIRAKGE